MRTKEEMENIEMAEKINAILNIASNLQDDCHK